VHLLVLTKVLYTTTHGMKNMSSMGLLWVRQCSSHIRKRRTIHSNSVFYSVKHDILTQVFRITPCRLVKSYGRFGGTLRLHLGLLALKMKVNWPVDRAKRRQETTNWRCVKSQKSADLIYTTITCWGCLWRTFTIKNRSLNIECIPSEHSDSNE
jgi:hypothetical protein